MRDSVKHCAGEVRCSGRATRSDLSSRLFWRLSGQNLRRWHDRNNAVYVAVGLNWDGDKEVLGLWIEQTEGAKFWLKVMSELKIRGLQNWSVKKSLNAQMPQYYGETGGGMKVRYAWQAIACRIHQRFDRRY